MMCSRSFRKVLVACALVGQAAWSAAPVGADIVPVYLSLDPATAAINTLDVSLDVNVTGVGSIGDDQTTTASGNVLANLYATFDPGTHAATVTGLEFTGGTTAYADMSFLLDFGVLGTIAADSAGMQSTSDTPAPPGTVTGTTFPCLEHEVIFNAGTVNFTATGLAATYLPPFTYDVSANPIITSANASGTLTVSAPTIVALNATYDVLLSIPLDFDESMYQDANASVTLSGAGTIQASGQFTRVIPEPASGLLLAFGAAAALLRRRHPR